MISESFIKFRQAVGKLCTIPFRESAHLPTSTLLLTNAAAFSAIRSRLESVADVKSVGIHKGQFGNFDQGLGSEVLTR